MNLSDLGWKPSFQSAFETLSPSGLHPARIIRQDKGRYLLQTVTCTLPGLLPGNRVDESLPAVGDWVAIQMLDDGPAIIVALLPRFSVFSRKAAGVRTQEQVIAANIDVLFLVSGMDGDFNLRRIERYVVQSSDSGALPVIVLNKADLCSNVEEYLEDVKRVVPGIDVYAVSALQDRGFEAIRSLIHPGITAGFVGSSGTGKSTLVNRLLGSERQSVGAVREDDSRGRHTTTRRELLNLPGGGLVIDTPGLRELQLWGDPDKLQGVFSDIEELALQCRFRDCTHVNEPGCAVNAAVEDGTIDLDRYESFLKLRREFLRFGEQQTILTRLHQKQKEREFGRMRRHINRSNPKR